MSFDDPSFKNDNDNCLNESNKQYIITKMKLHISEKKLRNFNKDLFYSVSIKNQNGISISDIFSISNILNIPLPVGLRILNSIKHEIDQYLVLEEDFMTICKLIYYSSFKEKIDLFFKICDVSNSDSLYKNDVIILFKHLLGTHMNDEILSLIEEFFIEGKDCLLKKQYLLQVEKCADLVFLFFLTISNNKIFHEDTVNYYNKNIQDSNNSSQPVIRKIYSSQAVDTQFAFRRPQTKKVNFKETYDDILLYNSTCAVSDSVTNANEFEGNSHSSLRKNGANDMQHIPSSKLLKILNKAFNYNLCINAKDEPNEQNDELDNCEDLEELSLFETQVVGSLKQILQKKHPPINSSSDNKQTQMTSINLMNDSEIDPDLARSITGVHKIKDLSNSGGSLVLPINYKKTVETKHHNNDKISKVREFDKIEIKKYGECKLYLHGCFLFIVLIKEPIQNVPFGYSPKKKLAKMPSVLLLKNISFNVNINSNTITLQPIHCKKYDFVFSKTTQFNKFIKKIDKINPNNYLRYQLEYEVIELLSEEEPLSFYSVKHKSSGSILKEKTISKLKYQENELGLEKYVLNYLKQHPHKNIVNIRDIYESVDNLHIIFEHQQKKSANIDIYTFLYDLLQGLHYLHSNGIVHRNISIENVIHDTQNGCCFKISNFSLSRTFFPSETFKDDLPFGVFSAPEVIEGKKYNSSCDIWSYGIVCFCILEGRIPFKEGKKDEMINNINDFLSKVLVKHIEDWKKRNKVYDKILSKTLIKSMFARPTTNDLLKMFQ